jgi:ribosomal protein S18 acetylase RimI-like enzyme
MNKQIRFADLNNKAELNQIFHIQQAAYAIEAKILELETEEFLPLRESLTELQSTSDEVWVYHLDDVIAGAIFLEKSEERILISKLIVDPKLFRRGIGKALVWHCLELYPESEFHVGTGSANHPAIDLYLSCNFKIFMEEMVEPNLKIVKLKRPSI